MKKHTELKFQKAILMLLLIFLLPFQLPILTPFSEGKAFKITRSQLRYRGTLGDINFSQTCQNINISDNITLLVAQTWLPVDEYPPPNETTRLFPCIANNESEKRYWYWNNQFINYIEKDLETIMISNFPDVFLQQEEVFLYPNLTSYIMMDYLRGDPRTSSTFLPEIATFRFNVTYLPNMSDFFSDSPDTEISQLLTQWENTTYEIENLVKTRWYVGNFSFREMLFSGGYPNPPIDVFFFFALFITLMSVTLYNFDRIEMLIKKLRN